MFNMIVVMYINYDVHQRDRSCQDLSGRSWIKTPDPCSETEQSVREGKRISQMFALDRERGWWDSWEERYAGWFSCPQQHQLVKHIIHNNGSPCNDTKVLQEPRSTLWVKTNEVCLFPSHLVDRCPSVKPSNRIFFPKNIDSYWFLPCLDFICVRPWERISKFTASTRWEKTLHFLIVSMQLRIIYKWLCHRHTVREINFYYAWNETTCSPKHIKLHQKCDKLKKQNTHGWTGISAFWLIFHLIMKLYSMTSCLYLIYLLKQTLKSPKAILKAEKLFFFLPSWYLHFCIWQLLLCKEMYTA